MSKRKRYNRTPSNPSRGGPGLLLTCEQGKERKCKQEALEILGNLLGISDESKTTDTDDNPKASLEDELADMKKDKNTNKVKEFVQEFDAACRGVVLLLFTPPSSSDGPSGPTYDKRTKLSANSEELSPMIALKAKESGEVVTEVEAVASTIPTPTLSPSKALDWDPIDIVAKVAQSMHDPSSTIPSSRWITRIVPLQITCFASKDAIEQSVKTLLTRRISGPTGKSFSSSTSKSPTTFAVQNKKRLADQSLRTQDLINAAAQGLPSDWKVNLTDPDVIVILEVCKTLCGVSLVLRDEAAVAKHWNMAELRATAHEQETRNDSKE